MTPSKELLDHLDELIEIALDRLYRQDDYLIYNRPNVRLSTKEHHHVGERTIVFRFAHYLQCLMDHSGCFSEYVVDCEYNRNGPKVKSLPDIFDQTFPDLVIHKRDSNDFNLLVMEFKPWWENDSDKILKDVKKLSGFTSTNHEFEYRYAKGYFIMVEKNKADLLKIPFTQGRPHNDAISPLLALLNCREDELNNEIRLCI